MELTHHIYAKGEMADRIRSFNWFATPLGHISVWPAPLITTLNLALDSIFPMFIFWGEEKIQFYNDASRQILGTAENSKHPDSLGKRAEECWTEDWPTIGPLIESVLQTGNAVYLEDQLIPIYRNNRMEEVYWTFSYSAIRGQKGKPEGIFVVCTETTKARKLLLENEQQLQRVLDHMAEGVCITDTSGQIVYSNPMAHQILRTENKHFSERKSNSAKWFNIHLDGSTMADDEHPTMIAMTTGKPVFNYEFAIERPGLDRMYLSMNAAPITNTDGNITGAVGMFSDITEHKRFEETLRQARDDSEQQKRLYETIMSATPDLVYVFDLNYRFTYANRALLETWGKTWNTAIGKDFRENGYEEWHAQMHEREIDHVIATRQSVRGEVSFPHATFGRRIYDYIFIPVINENGEIDAVAGTTRDITDIRKAEGAIAESEERFRAMAEGSGILIAMADESSNATYFSKAWTDLTGRPRKEMLKFGWLDFLHPEDRKRYKEIYLTAFEQRVPFTCEFRVLTKDGNYRWFLGNSPPRFHPDGTFAGYITACLDITEQKQNEQRKNDFISMVSHELKTPLTSTISYVQVSQRKAEANGDTLTAGMLQRAEKQLGKMTTLINGFLNVSRLEAGKIHIDRKRFDMAVLVKEVEDGVMPEASSHQVIFAPVEETWVNVDKDKIEQVINNFISNAIKYSPPNTSVKIACVTKGNYAYLSVTDEGIGIRAQDQEKLFNRFYRVEGQETKSIAGFGIGLYICKEIIQRHDGKIGVISQPEKGSTFWFTLPLDESRT